MTVWGFQGVPQSFFFKIRMPQTGHKASILNSLVYNLCTPCVFECVCVIFLLLQFSFCLVLRCCRCSHPAQASGANPDITSRSQQQQQNKCYQQKPASSAEPASPAKPDTASIIGTTRRTQQNQRYQQKPVLPAESVSLAEASRNSKSWQKRISLAENLRRTSIKPRSQQH